MHERRERARPREPTQHLAVLCPLLQDERLRSVEHDANRLPAPEVALDGVAVAVEDQPAQVRGRAGGISHRQVHPPSSLRQPGAAVPFDVHPAAEVDDRADAGPLERIEIVLADVGEVTAAEDLAMAHAAAVGGGVSADVAEVHDASQLDHAAEYRGIAVGAVARPAPNRSPRDRARAAHRR